MCVANGVPAAIDDLGFGPMGCRPAWDLHSRMRKNPARLAQLQQLAILDTAPEKVYADLARLLADSLAVPITMVNMLDAERDWFKACVGFPLAESPVETSFCEVFFDIANDVVVVEDTRTSDLFAKHPLVTGSPFIRFYAAARLTVGGQTVGTLCAYDVAPHKLSDDQMRHLSELAGAAMAALGDRSRARDGVRSLAPDA